MELADCSSRDDCRHHDQILHTAKVDAEISITLQSLQIIEYQVKLGTVQIASSFFFTFDKGIALIETVFPHLDVLFEQLFNLLSAIMQLRGDMADFADLGYENLKLLMKHLKSTIEGSNCIIEVAVGCILTPDSQSLLRIMETLCV